MIHDGKSQNDKIFDAFESGMYEFCHYLCLEEIKANPKNAFAWFYKGKTEFECNDYVDSIKSFMKGISIEPEATLFRANLGLSFENIGDNKQAIKYYFLEVRKFPESLYGWQVIVPFLVNNSRYNFAKKICDEMVKSGTMDYNFLAEEYSECLYQAGTLNEELLFYKKLKELNYHAPWAQENYNLLLKDINNDSGTDLERS